MPRSKKKMDCWKPPTIDVVKAPLQPIDQKNTFLGPCCKEQGPSPQFLSALHFQRFAFSSHLLFIPLFTAFFLFTSPTLVTASPNAKPTWVTRQKILLGTFVTVSLPSHDQQSFRPLFRELKRVEEELNYYDENSRLSRLNQQGLLSLSETMHQAMTLAAEIKSVSNGYFDVLFRSRPYEKPFRFLPLIPPPHKQLHFRRSWAILPPQGEMDLSGLHKGFAIDKSLEALALPLNNGLITAGGDIRCLSSCQIRVRSLLTHPQRSWHHTVLSFRKAPMAISTSGNTASIAATGKPHLVLDQLNSKRFPNHYKSLTLFAPVPSGWLDGLTTASFLMPPEQLQIFLQTKNIGYLYVLPNHKVRYFMPPSYGRVVKTEN